MSKGRGFLLFLTLVATAFLLPSIDLHAGNFNVRVYKSNGQVLFGTETLTLTACDQCGNVIGQSSTATGTFPQISLSVPNCADKTVTLTIVGSSSGKTISTTGFNGNSSTAQTILFIMN